ncbi:MAG: methionine--tRNA ligase [Hyphomicrobiaceae bacterium]
MAEREKFYITTPIFYPNGVPHLGHAYTALVTDAIARFERLSGKDVFFLTGTDEHGLKMKQTAIKEGLTPLALADRNSAVFRHMEDALGCSYDDFIRTTEPRHHEACAELWRRIEKAGHIYSAKYAGWYSVRQEAYFDEKETTLGSDGVRREPLGSPVEWTEEETYFFKLSAFQDKLLAHYQAHPDFILPPERRNEVASFVAGGLQDLSISRGTLDWGIQVPSNPKHVMYVWIDALNNYVTATGLLNAGDNPRKKFWPCDVHVIGKDIVRFHAVYWPAFLMAAGLPLPERVFAHGFMLNKGEKMSKSVGNVVDPFDLIAAYGVDAVRYFFLREVAFGADGSYGPDAIETRINADLANGLGNLAQRSLSMIAKGFEGNLPSPGPFTNSDQAILAAVDAIYPVARAAMDKQAIKTWLDACWTVIGDADRYFASEKPFDKTLSVERKGTILYVAAEVVRQLAILVQPAVPVSAAKLLDLLGQTEAQRTFASLGAAGRLAPGLALPPPVGVFPRYVRPVDPDEAAAAKSAKPPKQPKKGKEASGGGA